VLAWLSVWADASATPSSVASSFIKIHIGLTFLVPAYSGCPGKEVIKGA